MARKNIILHSLFETVGNPTGEQSLSASFISPVTSIQYQDNISYQIIGDGNASEGTFTVQGSNNYRYNNVTDVVTAQGDWVDLPLGGSSSGPKFIGVADSIIIDMNQVPFAALRVKYTSTVAGTGKCKIFLVAKEIGG